MKFTCCRSFRRNGNEESCTYHGPPWTIQQSHAPAKVPWAYDKHPEQESLPLRFPPTNPQTPSGKQPAPTPRAAPPRPPAHPHSPPDPPPPSGTPPKRPTADLRLRREIPRPKPDLQPRGSGPPPRTNTGGPLQEANRLPRPSAVPGRTTKTNGGRNHAD